MNTATMPHRSLTEDLAAVQRASLTMNDMFLAEAALISQELLLDLMRRKNCQLSDITAEDIVADLKQRAPMTYSLPALPRPTEEFDDYLDHPKVLPDLSQEQKEPGDRVL